MKKQLILLVVTSLFTAFSSAQISYKLKEINVSMENSTICMGYTYSAKIPLFQDTSAFIQTLQDSLLAICAAEYREDDMPSKNLNFDDFRSNFDCGNEESTNISFQEFLNTRDVFSFALYCSWGAGGGGLGTDGRTLCFNYDMKRKSRLILAFIFGSKYEVVMNKMEKKAKDRYDNVGQLTGFMDFSVKPEGIEFYYGVMYSGSKGGFTQTILSWKDAELYMTKEAKALLVK